MGSIFHEGIFVIKCKRKFFYNMTMWEICWLDFIKENVKDFKTVLNDKPQK